MSRFDLRERVEEVLRQGHSMGPDERAAMLESVIPSLLRARFDAAEIAFSEEQKQLRIESLLDAVRSQTGAASRAAERNGFVREELRSSNRSIVPPGRKLWAGIGVAAAALVVLFMLTQLQPGSRLREWIAGGPERWIERPAPGPEMPPTDESRPQDRPAPVPQEGEPSSQVPESGRPPRTDPGRTSQEGLLAQRVEVGMFSKVVGEPAWRLPGDKADRRVQPNAPLFLGVTVRTGDTDQVELVFEDGTTLSLGFNTEIEVTAGSSRPDTDRSRRAGRVALRQGSVWAAVNPATAVKFAIVSPVATAEVLGTEFGLKLSRIPVKSGANARGLKALLQVKSGKVAFFNNVGRVEAGPMTESLAVQGAKPTEPQRVPVLKKWAGKGEHLMISGTERLGAEKATLRYLYPLGWSGLHLISREDGTVAVAGVEANSPAEKAGVIAGDRIVMLNGIGVRSGHEVRIASQSQVGAVLALELLRGTERNSATLVTEPFWEIDLQGRVSEEVRTATWHAIQGRSDVAEAMLRHILQSSPSAAAHNNLGVISETQDRLGEAIRHYRAAVRLAPGFPRYRYNLGMALRSIGNLERSLEEFELAVAVGPGWSTLVFQLSQAYSLLDRHEDALEIAVESLERLPSASDVWEAKGQALVKLGRTDEAIQALKRAIELSPGSPYHWYTLADAYHDLGQAASAEQAARKAIELDPHYAYPRRLLGHLLRDFGRHVEAAAEYRRVIELGDEDPEIFNEYGASLYRSGHVQQAEEAVRRAIQLDPTYAGGYNTLGIIYEHKGNVAAAERAWRKSIEVEPFRWHGYANLASMLEGQGRKEDAEEVYLQGIEATREARLCLRYIQFLTREGKTVEAETMFKKAVAFDPGNAAIHFEHGIWLINQSRRGDAEGAYARAIEIDSKYVEPRVNLAILLEERGALRDAEMHYRAALAVNSDHFNALYNFGRLLNGLGRFEEAEPLLRRAAEIRPDHAPSHYVWGQVLQKLGREKEAEAAFRRAVSLAPNSVNTQYWIASFLNAQGRHAEAEAALRDGLARLPGNEFLLALLSTALEKLGKTDELEAVLRERLVAKPGNANLLNSLAWNLAERGVKLDEALDIARRAVQIEPEVWAHSDTLGWVHFKRGEIEGAERILQSALSKTAEPSELSATWYRIGRVYEKREDLNGAREAYRKSLALDPNQAEAQEALKRIGG